MADIEELYKTLMEEDKSEFSIKELVEKIKPFFFFLWAKKWIIIIVTLIGSILGLVYIINKKINYTATYVFSIEGGNPTTSGISSISSLLGFGGGSIGAFSGDNLVELIKSRRLIEKALLSPVALENEEKTFMEFLISVDSLRNDCYKAKPLDNGLVSICDINYPLNQDRETFSRAQDSFLLATSATLVKENITVVKRDKKLAFVEFSVTSTNEVFSKLFAESLLNEVSPTFLFVGIYNYNVSRKVPLSKSVVLKSVKR